MLSQPHLIRSLSRSSRQTSRLNGTFSAEGGSASGGNPLNQLTHLTFDGKLDVVGTVGATGVAVKVSGTNAVMFNGTNYWGSTRIHAGSNSIPIVAWLGTKKTEMNHTVHFPPTNPQKFLWDRNGNLTNDGQKAYFWDEEDRMKGASSAGMTAVYSYDSQSRRVRKVVGSTTNTFVWDGWLLVQEISSDGTTNVYTWGHDLSGRLQGAGGIGGLVSVTRSTSSGTFTYYPCYDANGNVTDYLDTNGAIVAHREYDAFGNTLVATGPMVNDFHFWFSTKYFDAETGLYYYGYRHYSPMLGRWLSRDPITEIGSPAWMDEREKRLRKRNERINAVIAAISRVGGALHLSEQQFVQFRKILSEGLSPSEIQNVERELGPNSYIFCLNNPLNHFDPTGLQTPASAAVLSEASILFATVVGAVGTAEALQQVVACAALSPGQEGDYNSISSLLLSVLIQAMAPPGQTLLVQWHVIRNSNVCLDCTWNLVVYVIVDPSSGPPPIA